MVFSPSCPEVETVIVVIAWGVGVCITATNKTEESIKTDSITPKKISSNKWSVFFTKTLNETDYLDFWESYPQIYTS